MISTKVAPPFPVASVWARPPPPPPTPNFFRQCFSPVSSPFFQPFTFPSLTFLGQITARPPAFMTLPSCADLQPDARSLFPARPCLFFEPTFLGSHTRCFRSGHRAYILLSTSRFTHRDDFPLLWSPFFLSVLPPKSFRSSYRDGMPEKASLCYAAVVRFS